MDYKELILLILLLPTIGAAGGFLIGLNDEKKRDIFNIIITGINFIIVSYLFIPLSSHTGMEVFIPNIMGVGLDLKIDMLRYVFIWITSFIWFLATVYSSQYLINYINRNRYYAFFMLTLGATLGVFMSENIINLSTFFEIMSFTSYVLIIHDQDRYAHDAGISYLAMAIAGSFILLMGLFLAYDYTGAITLAQLKSSFQSLGPEKYIIAVLMLIGFGVKASAFPLHVWLPKAHPAAPSPASAVLSGILIKTGIFGILMVSTFIFTSDLKISYLLTTIGLINMFLGGFLAMFQRNIKTIFAYSSMSQAGYILLGIGLVGLLKYEGSTAMYGVLFHIFNHAIFKVLLFFIAGLIYMVLHELSINIIRGFGKHTKVLKIVFIIAMCAITGVPGFSGYIGKTIIHHSLSEAAHMNGGIYFTIAEIVFTISSAFTVAYLTKVFVSVFLHESDDYKEPTIQEKVKSPIYHMSLRALIPLIALSLMILLTGLFPYKFMGAFQTAMGKIGYGLKFNGHLFDIHSILSSLFTIVLGLIIYIFFIRRLLVKEIAGEKEYINPTNSWFSIERDFYKPIFKNIYHGLFKVFHFIDHGLITGAENAGNFFNNILLKEVKMDFYGEYQEARADEHKTIAEIIGYVKLVFNSMVYSLYIFAIILALTLLFIMSYK
ncbi:MAG: proton-conducting transporter membrane subunit [Andreesenia angusta]|nr:proton-conducting transporter membrane subunit [Andreesenia angusta]